MSGTVEVNETGSDSRSAKGATWVRRSEVPPFSPAPGIQIQPVIGESLMTCWIAMEPGAVVAEHSHVHEQLGVVVEGSVTLTVAGETRELVVGDAYLSALRSRAQRGCRGEWCPPSRNLRAGPRGVRQGLARHRRRIIDDVALPVALLSGTIRDWSGSPGLFCLSTRRHCQKG